MADNQDDGQAGAPKRSLGQRLKMLGPGLITGASDDDPSGIATYSQAGAKFGFNTGWLMLISWPLMWAIQEISARIGRVTGRGIAGNMARHYPRKIVLGIIALLFIANIINIGADLGAMGAALQLVIGGPNLLYVLAFASVSALLQVFVCYKNYVRVLKWLTLVLFAYVGVTFAVDVPWKTVAYKLIAPSIEFNADYLVIIVAILGTTISPYLFFWQAEEEVEEMVHQGDAKPLKKDASQAPAEFERIRFDTVFGMGLSNIVALFIIVTCAATLHASGVTEIETSAQAAEALRPIAGDWVFLIFALGIIGTGLLAIPVLAGSAAYALGEAFGWPIGLGKKAGHAKAFYITIAGSTLVGALLNFTPIDPIKALIGSAVINGVVAVPVMVMMMLLASKKAVMGSMTLSPTLKGVGWAATAVMLFAVLGMVVTWTL